MIASGYYGTDTETYWQHADGAVWVVSHETGHLWVVDAVPADVVPLSELAVSDIDWSELEDGR